MVRGSRQSGKSIQRAESWGETQTSAGVLVWEMPPTAIFPERKGHESPAGMALWTVSKDPEIDPDTWEKWQALQGLG